LALHFSDYSFLVHHPVNRDGLQLLAHAMASDFTATRQFSQREHLVFSLWIKLHALIRLGVSPPTLGHYLLWTVFENYRSSSNVGATFFRGVNFLDKK
jgi:hypothetical protein